ncbi:MAG: aminomethyltransferase family protein [Terriglobia bacterium]
MAASTRSPLADYHASQGARLVAYHGGLVPARFSDPRQEHEAVRQAAGLFDFSFRTKLAVTGADRVRFLQGTVTNDVKNLTPSHGTYAAMLNPQGHILADLRIYCAEDRFVIDTDADLHEKIFGWLQHHIIADRVKLEPLEMYALTFQGPRSRPLLEKTLHLDLPAMEEFDHLATNYAGFPIRIVRASSTGEEGYEVWVGAKGLPGVWGAACGQAPTYEMLPCGVEALESLRIEAGIPRYGPDLAEDTLLLEADLVNAVSFTKGCYIGQEIVERSRSRGHINWKLVGLVVDAAEAPAPGEKLSSDAKEVGEVTSACVSPTLGKTIALAYVRREVAEPGTKLVLASGIAAEVTTLPFYKKAETGN